MPARHIYVHIPFCTRRCSYCDFAIAVRRTIPVEEFLGALEREIAVRMAGVAPVPVDTIYLGGGTPSRLGAAGIERVLAMLQRYWEPAPDAEVTIEANPEDVDADSATAWRGAGITRVSLGVQSFDDEVLKWMHRSHDAGRATAAAEILRAAGFTDWSLDLVFALPDSLHRDWRCDLDSAIALGPPHVSCYGLTVEPHTPLMHWRERGLAPDTPEDRYESEFLEAHERLLEAGYEHYEVSNFARPGHRARHNSAYWERVPYLGFGPSAHSFDGASRRWNEREYAAWVARLSGNEDPVAGAENLTPEQVRTEELYLALRTSDGVQLADRDRQFIAPWQEQGWLYATGERAWASARGWLRLDTLATALTDFRSRY